jgi:nucleoid-associated protein YgaU
VHVTTRSKAAKKRATSKAAYGHYVVRSGDSLSAIAHRKHVRGGWHALYKANKRAIGSNPNMIRVGQRLRLPR